MVSAKVRPMRKKNGLPGNDPGAVICASVADPSRIVLIAARITIRRASFRRTPFSAMV
jgi:hypothetical protein